MKDKHTRLIKCFLLLLPVSIVCEFVFAQTYPVRFQHLSIEEGLSNNNVYSITQDKYGLIWIGTSDGLNRYDGYKVEVYRNIHNDETSIPSNEVLFLFTDSRGIVWVGTGNGLAYFDERTNSFHSFYRDSLNSKSLPGNVISVIAEDSRGLLWIGTSNGLCSFDLKRKNFQRWLPDGTVNSISDKIIRDIEVGRDGNLWISTSNGLNRFDLTTNKFNFYLHNPGDNSFSSNHDLGKIAIDNSDNVWTYPNITSELICFNTDSNIYNSYTKYRDAHSKIPLSYLNTVFFDSNGRLLLANNNSGLGIYFPDTDTYHEYKADVLDENGLQSNSIRSIFQDRSGLIWLATNTGAERLNLYESKFFRYRIPSNSAEAPPFKVRAFTEDPLLNIWIGTQEAMYVLDRSTGIVKKYEGSDSKTNPSNRLGILAICRDKQNQMWLGTMNGLRHYDEVKKEFRVLYRDSSKATPSRNFIPSLVCDKNGDLLLGSRGGLSIYNTKTGALTNFKYDTARPLLNEQINVVFEDNQGIIWLGMRNNGLVRFDRLKGIVSNYTKINTDIHSLPANYISSITQDKNGIIWIGTQSGLSQFNESTQKFKTYTEKQGLPNIHIGQLQVDDKNRIWIGTNRGISVLNELRTEFTNYDPGDGLQGWEFSEGFSYKAHDGYFCFAGTKGFNLFHPDSIRKNNFKPPVIVTQIKVFDKKWNADSSYLDLRSIKLSYKQNFIAFEFAALSFDHPEKNQYACQLIGFDRDMVKLGFNRTISYTNVPPGSYRLIVMGSNNDGVWSGTRYELLVVITPPFWATWWFIVIAIIACLGLVLFFISVRVNKVKEEQARITLINKQIAEIRMNALRSQMNPHFIFNSLNAIQHFVASSEKEEALNYLSKFSKLIRKSLENSRFNMVSLSNEVQLIELYIQLEQLRFNNKFDYHIRIDENIDLENTEVPPMLIQPYVENAILHGLIHKEGKGDLWLSFRRSNEFLICMIEDNGIGRARSQDIQRRKVSRHKSLGIEMTEERISGLHAFLGQKLEVLTEDLFESQCSQSESLEPAGTRVSISIPIVEEE